VIPKSKCEADYAPVSRVKISDNQLCAGTGDRDTCTGDSGGPMLSDQVQGCQMVSFQTKKSQFWRTLDWKIYFMAIWNISQTFGIFFDHLVHFVFIWYILCSSGDILCSSGTFCVHLVHFFGFRNIYQEKSGNPDQVPDSNSKTFG
jgi:hypothetical protein